MLSLHTFEYILQFVHLSLGCLCLFLGSVEEGLLDLIDFFLELLYLDFDE